MSAVESHSAMVCGSAVAVKTTVPGQNGVVSFAGTAGQRVSVSVTGNTMGFTTFPVLHSFPTRRSSDLSSGSLFLEPVTLPATGTYTLLADPSGSNVGSVSRSEERRVGKEWVSGRVGGSAETVATTVPGQNGVVSFAGTAGQRVSVSVTGNTMVFLTFRGKQTNALCDWCSDVCASDLLEPVTLPATGTYTLLADPSGSNVGSVS